MATRPTTAGHNLEELPNMVDETQAIDVYEIVEKRMNIIKRWGMMAAFWAFALLSMGSATPVPSTKAWAVVRRSDGTQVALVDEPAGGDESISLLLTSDLAALSKTDFESAWGIS